MRTRHKHKRKASDDSKPLWQPRKRRTAKPHPLGSLISCNGWQTGSDYWRNVLSHVKTSHLIDDIWRIIACYCIPSIDELFQYVKDMILLKTPKIYQTPEILNWLEQKTVDGLYLDRETRIRGTGKGLIEYPNTEDIITYSIMMVYLGKEGQKLGSVVIRAFDDLGVLWNHPKSTASPTNLVNFLRFVWGVNDLITTELAEGNIEIVTHTA